jgi:hypothetical protein
MTANVQPPEDIDTDWASITLRAFNMAIAVGAIEPADDEEPDPWAADMPGWRRAAAEYHSDRAGRTAIVETTWHELNRRDGAPQATVEALMFSLRFGIDALREPSTLRRLAQLDVSQAQEVAERVRKFKPEIAPAWELDAVEALLEIWMKRHAR